MEAPHFRHHMKGSCPRAWQCFGRRSFQREDDPDAHEKSRNGFRPMLRSRRWRWSGPVGLRVRKSNRLEREGTDSCDRFGYQNLEDIDSVMKPQL